MPATLANNAKDIAAGYRIRAIRRASIIQETGIVGCAKLLKPAVSCPKPVIIYIEK
jgi:hypothetical protein